MDGALTHPFDGDKLKGQFGNELATAPAGHLSTD